MLRRAFSSSWLRSTESISLASSWMHWNHEEEITSYRRSDRRCFTPRAAAVITHLSVPERDTDDHVLSSARDRRAVDGHAVHLLPVTRQSQPWSLGQSDGRKTLKDVDLDSNTHVIRFNTMSIKALNIQRHVRVHLGSKRGVMSGVQPMTEDSRRLRAGVIKGFLVDLRTKQTRIFRRANLWPSGRQLIMWCVSFTSGWCCSVCWRRALWPSWRLKELSLMLSSTSHTLKRIKASDYSFIMTNLYFSCEYSNLDLIWTLVR